ncbi:hypothetical protein KJ781_00760 [Patescibacteria group bacterium]|nr:hypothetical protein [Patescibacteria group bacterium]MBU1449012.1 hypothetical protein [Patescibacteria group bacterium]MBU2612843.1 hypothetical protein [Patescibacteria group bacterium]
MRTLETTIRCSAETFSFADEFNAHHDEQESPGRAPRRVPAGRARGGRRRRRWYETFEPIQGLGQLDREFGRLTMNALAREDLVPTASEVEDEFIAAIDARRRKAVDTLDEYDFTLLLVENDETAPESGVRLVEIPEELAMNGTIIFDCPVLRALRQVA